MSQTLAALGPVTNEVSAASTAGQAGDFTTGVSDIHQAQTSLTQAQTIWNAGPPPPTGDKLAGVLNADVDAAIRHYSAALAYYNTGFTNKDINALASGIKEYNQGTADFTDANNKLLGR